MPVYYNEWTLEDGLKLVRAIQNTTRKYGYHLTLGGGVLNNGKSKKDLDLYFLPLNNERMPPQDIPGLVGWLGGMWGKFESIGKNYGATIPTITFSDGSLQSAAVPWVTIQDNSAPLNSSGITSEISQPAPASVPRARSIYSSARIPFSDGNNWYLDDGSIDPLRRTNIIPRLPQMLPPELTSGGYKYKLKFLRNNVDRIDVFII